MVVVKTLGKEWRMMEDTPQQYIPQFLIKLANINTFYLVVAGFLVLLISQKWNILDILYLGVVTYCYLRIKIHRWKLKK